MANLARKRKRLIVLTVLVCLAVASLPVLYALFRNYQWNRSQPARTAVPNLVGLDLNTGTQKARSLKLDTSVIGKTWHSDLPAGRISLQAPEAGQLVPMGTVIGVEITVPPPNVGSPTPKQSP